MSWIRAQFNRIPAHIRNWVRLHAVSLIAVGAGLLLTVLVYAYAKGANPAGVSSTLGILIQAGATLTGLSFVGATFIRTLASTASAKLDGLFRELRTLLAEPGEGDLDIGVNIYIVVREAVIHPGGEFLFEPEIAFDMCHVLRATGVIREDETVTNDRMLITAIQQAGYRGMTPERFNEEHSRLAMPDFMEKFHNVARAFIWYRPLRQRFPALATFIENNRSLRGDIALVRKNATTRRLYRWLLGLQTFTLLLAVFLLGVSSQVTESLGSGLVFAYRTALTTFVWGIILLGVYAEGLLHESTAQ